MILTGFWLMYMLYIVFFFPYQDLQKKIHLKPAGDTFPHGGV